ncbi:MAG: hypothetical protein HRT58_02700 [Crocinitomicaceae bacterium]|nr:hypothetical protein [Flavobacteriales bacterium]NQZ34539.1 hypothetical protein [Crocinitomicaceae bacterium]
MKTILLIFTLSICSISFSQGLIDGYFKGKGKVDIALSGFYQKAESYFAGVDELQFPNQYISFEDKTFTSFGVFAEYGITSKWDVIANVPLINGSFQDAAVATKYELVKTKVGGRNLSIIPALAVSFPLTNYETENFNAIGQRATVFSPKLVLQHNLPHGLFVQVQSGYNYALSPVTSSVAASAKIGGSFGKLYVDVWYDFQHGFGEKDFLSTDPPFSSFRELVVSYQRVGGVVYYELAKKFGVFVNSSFIFDGRNAYKSLGFGGGVVFKLKVN